MTKGMTISSFLVFALLFSPLHNDEGDVIALFGPGAKGPYIFENLCAELTG